MNTTAPAVNVKGNATAYTMEVAAPSLKKDMVKMNIDKDGYLNVSIEQKADKNVLKIEIPKVAKEEKKDDVKKIEVK